MIRLLVRKPRPQQRTPINTNLRKDEQDGEKWLWTRSQRLGDIREENCFLSGRR